MSHSLTFNLRLSTMLPKTTAASRGCTNNNFPPPPAALAHTSYTDDTHVCISMRWDRRCFHFGLWFFFNFFFYLLHDHISDILQPLLFRNVKYLLTDFEASANRSVLLVLAIWCCGILCTVFSRSELKRDCPRSTHLNFYFALRRWELKMSHTGFTIISNNLAWWLLLSGVFYGCWRHKYVHSSDYTSHLN